MRMQTNIANDYEPIECNKEEKDCQTKDVQRIQQNNKNSLSEYSQKGENLTLTRKEENAHCNEE